MFYRERHSQSLGFTLIELLVVIAIISILASLVLIFVGRSRINAKNSAAMSDIGEAGKSIEAFKVATDDQVIANLSTGADNLTLNGGTIADIFTGLESVKPPYGYGVAMARTHGGGYDYNYVTAQPSSPSATVRQLVSAQGSLYIVCGSIQQAATHNYCIQDGRVVVDSSAVSNQPLVNLFNGVSLYGSLTILEDTPIVFNATNHNAISLNAPAAGSSVIQFNLTSLGGRLLLPDVSNLTLTGGSNNSATMTYTGTLANLNAALNGLSFIPTPNGNGSAHVTITTNDLGNNGTGTPLADSDTISITITPVNDAPVANTESYTVTGGSALSVDAVHGVLANDTDVEHDPLTAAKVSNTAQGTVTFNSDGSFDYAPNASISVSGGSDSFTYKANDSKLDSAAATVTITVTAQTVATCADVSEVTSSVQITRAALRFNAISGRYVQQVTLKNNGAPITGPVFLVLDGLAGGTLFNQSGTVACFAGLVSDTFRTQPGSLATGASAVVNLEFEKTGPTISYTPRVLTGSGTP